MHPHNLPPAVCGAVASAFMAAVSFNSFRAIGAHDGPVWGMVVFATACLLVVLTCCLAAACVGARYEPRKRPETKKERVARRLAY